MMSELGWTGQPSDNLTTLTQLTEHTLLEALKQRYLGNHIYTDVGDILVAINPFQQLPIYTESWSQAYSQPDVSLLAPHIFKVASRAYSAMLSERKDQVCVISGESGAGKTESAKLIMRQVMSMCRSAGLGQKLQHKITQLNPILEAFGNAQTALNNNSSRFGKYVQLVFDSSGRIVGAGLQQYLLEKSRVCVQGDKERNFHIFYYLYAGLAANQKERLRLKEPTCHRYLKSYPGVVADSNSEASREMYKEVIKSLEEIGLKEEEVEALHNILAGVLLLGDIEFKGADSGDENAEIRNPDAAETVSSLLQLESSEELCFALTKLRTETRGEVVDKCYSVTKAADVRDGLAKALYARMFQWIVSRLNGYLQPYPDNDQLTMGILDIFGFENFESNSFEQFCINLANEQLQCYFNHQIFAMEKMELEKEGLEELDITFRDNKPVLDLYLDKPIGLLSLLNDQCRGLNGSEKAFVQKCKESFSKHPNYTPHRGNALVFTIKHYAGDVQYKVSGFLEKNKDSLPESVVGAVKYSSIRLIRTLFMRGSEHTTGSNIRKNALLKSQRTVMKAMSISRRRRSSVRVKKGGGRKVPTVGAHFRQSLDDLMERLFAASPHFVRCLKPNLEKVSGKWNHKFMLKQLQYTGMLEAVRVRREGFAYRPFFNTFFSLYRGLAYDYTDQSVKGCEAACREILAKAELENWRMGSSRVFLRYYHQEKLQLLVSGLNDKAILIQKVYRGFHTRRWTKGLREKQKQEKELVSNFLSAMNKKCEEIFPVIVSLNRTDNLLANERFSHRREAATVTRVDSYSGLDTQQRNVKRAKKLGIKMIPSVRMASGSPVNLRKHSEDESSTQESPNHENEQVVDEIHPQAAQDSELRAHSETDTVLRSPSQNVPLPRPRSRSRPPSENRLSSEPEVVSSSPLSPVPRPRSTISTLPEIADSAVTTTQTVIPKPAPRRIRRVAKSTDHPSPNHSLEQEHHESSIPHYQLPVGGATILSTNQLPVSDTTKDVDYRPVAKPRKSPTPSPHHAPQRQASEARAEIRVPLVSTDSEGVSLDFFPGAKGQSTLDFVPNGRPQKSITSLQLEKESSPDPELNLEELYVRRPSMASNLANLRLLANSVNSLVDESTSDTKRYSVISTGSENNSLDHPPQADKRVTKKGFWSASGWKHNRRSRLGSCSSSLGGSVTDLRMSSEISELLGFHPQLDQLAAEDFVLGQPRGTYVICKGTSSVQSEESYPAHILVLSLGRSVQSVPIITISTPSGEQFQLQDKQTQPQASFPLLRDLVDHYRRHPVIDGVCLLQPRLLAGVYVSPTPSPCKPPVTPRRKLPVPRKRRKFSKPSVTEVEVVA